MLISTAGRLEVGIEGVVEGRDVVGVRVGLCLDFSEDPTSVGRAELPGFGIRVVLSVETSFFVDNDVDFRVVNVAFGVDNVGFGVVNANLVGFEVDFAIVGILSAYFKEVTGFVVVK